MKIPLQIIEDDEVESYIIKRNLSKQYTKSKQLILSWDIWWTKFWIKEPKQLNIRYFRINKQYRAIGYWENQTFIVSYIDDHQ